MIVNFDEALNFAETFELVRLQYHLKHYNERIQTMNYIKKSNKLKIMNAYRSIEFCKIMITGPVNTRHIVNSIKETLLTSPASNNNHATPRRCTLLSCKKEGRLVISRQKYSYTKSRCCHGDYGIFVKRLIPYPPAERYRSCELLCPRTLLKVFVHDHRADQTKRTRSILRESLILSQPACRTLTRNFFFLRSNLYF